MFLRYVLGYIYSYLDKENEVESFENSFILDIYRSKSLFEQSQILRAQQQQKKIERNHFNMTQIYKSTVLHLISFFLCSSTSCFHLLLLLLPLLWFLFLALKLPFYCYSVSVHSFWLRVRHNCLLCPHKNSALSAQQKSTNHSINAKWTNQKIILSWSLGNVITVKFCVQTVFPNVSDPCIYMHIKAFDFFTDTFSTLLSLALPLSPMMNGEEWETNGS